MKSRIIGAAAALLLLGICLSLVGNWWISDHESDGIRRVCHAFLMSTGESSLQSPYGPSCGMQDDHLC